MLDSLLDGIKGQVAGAIAEKAGIDRRQAEQAVPLAGESIKEGVMGAVTSGKVGDVMNLLSGLSGEGAAAGGAASMLSGLVGGGGMMKNMVFQGIANNFVGKLTSKLGLPASIASTVSSMALPMIMNKIKGAASNDAGEVNPAGLMKTLGLDPGVLLSDGADALKGQAMDAAEDKLGGLGGGLSKLFG